MVHNVHSERRKVCDGWYKENLMTRILSKQMKAEEVKKSREHIQMLSREKNTTLRNMVSAVSRKQVLTMQPVAFETHHNEWRAEMRKHKKVKQDD